jgi:hypothetical protein
MALTLDGDNGVSGVNGSAGTPALQGTDTNTGISFGTDTVNLVTGGTNRATVDSSGRLLVGTSTAFSSTRNAYESEATPTRVEYVATATNSVNNGFGVYNFSSSGYAPNLDLCASKNNTVGGHSVVSSDQAFGHINFGGSDGTQFRTGATILGATDGTPGSGDMPGKLVFSTTADGSSSPTERMRIASNGRLTIDTASQSTRIKRNDAASGSAIIEFQNSSTTPAYIRLDGGLANVQSNDLNLSDEREKKNIVNLDSTWDCLKHWELKKFHYNDQADTEDKKYGVIAQQIAPHCPEVIDDWVKQEAKEAELDSDGNVVTPERKKSSAWASKNSR